ncbi:MAG: glycosyltransferase family 4 protein [Rhodospirillales bacterium]
MARIVMADDGIRFDGRVAEASPLGGAESAFTALAEEFAARGHDVTVCNNCAGAITHKGVTWRPIAQGLPDGPDMYIANRGDKLIDALPSARKQVFWTHNPSTYMVKMRYMAKLWKVRPDIVFIGDYHATTYPRWAPGGRRHVIPYGITRLFLDTGPAEDIPPPRAIFTSNPLRGLDWLLDVWNERIRPQVPAAELHLFCGPGTYGQAGIDKAGPMRKVLQRAWGMGDSGVVLREPVRKAELIGELLASRVMLYRGDINETFCYALAEAQALGLPCVVQPIGSVIERVIDGETGYIRGDDAGFAEAAVRILTDDVLWRSQQQASRDKQRLWGWPEAAARFEQLLP